jgi:hypothetical protein
MSGAVTASSPGAGALQGPLALDAASLADHTHLSALDRCYCLAEYLPGYCRRTGHVNQLIADLKCKPSIAAVDPRRRHYKLQAIIDVAAALRAAVSRQRAESATWVPIPPSRVSADSDYDDRLLQVVARAFFGYDLDLRLLLYQTRSVDADHTLGQRLSMDALGDLIRLDQRALRIRPPRAQIVLFDDVLTSGKHYKCCERRLREFLPHSRISGLFVARRALPRRWRGIPDPSGV